MSDFIRSVRRAARRHDRADRTRHRPGDEPLRPRRRARLRPQDRRRDARGSAGRSGRHRRLSRRAARSARRSEPCDDFDYQFFFEVLVGGLLSGVMYSLVAIGFVLIYKTSGVLNFAQGPLLLFAALTYVSLVERGVPVALALVIVFAVMALIGLLIERSGAAAARQPPADHAVHGDARARLCRRRRRAVALGRAGAWARYRRQRHAVRRLRRVRLQIRSVRGGDRGSDGRRPDRVLPIHPHWARLPRRGRRFLRRARDRPQHAASSSRRPGSPRASRRWSRACCGARGSACSSRCRWSC